jgi:hypothetical protein
MRNDDIVIKGEIETEDLPAKAREEEQRVSEQLKI